MTDRYLRKNTTLGYWLVGLNNSFFWYAPWLLFLLKYIDLSQVAILQAVGLVTSVVVEVPSGALSDLIGKKKTLMVAFFIAGLGEMIMAFSNNFSQFVLAYVVLNVGYSFYSGTMEAFMFDTLVSRGKEDTYSKIVSRKEAVANGAVAFASIMGGLMFKVWIGLPFLITGITKFVGLAVCMFIDEPPVDTDHFSFKTFARQTTKGFEHLLGKKVIKWSSLLLIFGVFSAIAYEILDDVAVVDWGLNAEQIGILYATATLIAIPSGFVYEKVVKYVSAKILLVGGVVFLVLNYMFSPWITAPVWIGLFLVRVFYSPIKNAAISELINHNTSSNIRATTLSTYELLRKIPFVLFAGAIGVIMESKGVKIFSVYFALLLAGLVVLHFLLVGLLSLLRNRNKFLKRVGILFMVTIVLFLGLFLYYWKAWDRSLFLNPIYRLDTNEKVVALTFDDGPSLVRTPLLLDVLDKYDVKATFFMLGQNIEKYPEVAREVVARGHMVGNHSYSHPRLILKSPALVNEEIEKTNMLLREIGSEDWEYFRPPNTKKFIVLPYLLKSKGMKLVTGSFDPGLQYQEPFDWEGVSRQVIDNVIPGEIVYLHDGKNASGEEFARAVERIIVELKGKGYQFILLENE